MEENATIPVPVDAPGSPADPLAGTPYRALGELGRGGMGEVLEAQHRGLNKRVVVKLLHRQFANDPRFADRLRVEAQALAAVSSPHVVSVSDLGQTPEGRSYLVMERLHGRTLREELDAQGPFSVLEAIRVTRQVLAGVAAAHRLGIVHRDVKLANVFLCSPVDQGAPVVKVLDFGIAKVLHSKMSPAALPSPIYPTEQGSVVGSPRTMSPEQLRCGPVDARTDIYAVGLLLYTLLVGHGPFDQVHDMLDLLNAHLRQIPKPPSSFAHQYVPPELDLAVLKAIAKRPEQRFQSAELFAEELGRIAALVARTTQPIFAVRAVEDDGPAQEIESPTPVDAPRAVMNETDRGTLVIPRLAAGPLPLSEAAPAPPMLDDSQADAWFDPEPGDSLLVTLPRNLAAPTPPASPARLFALLTIASTLVFSMIAALLFRFLGR
ncbi:MAG: serine/threonine-protein kinase [Byssovorax sp.]